MERIIISLIVLLTISKADGQKSREWTQQKQTQVKYLLEQIGALNAYSEVINKGYAIAQHGLTNVVNSKEADYHQHNNYFLSLWKVNPGIKRYNKVLSVLNMKREIERQNEVIKSSTPFLNDKERRYVNAVYIGLIGSCNDLKGELEMVITAEQMQMKDDERIQRVDKIYRRMQDHYQFSASFANEIKMLVGNRNKEVNDFSKQYLLRGMK